jgi:hypothetical protein
MHVDRNNYDKPSFFLGYPSLFSEESHIQMKETISKPHKNYIRIALEHWVRMEPEFIAELL